MPGSDIINKANEAYYNSDEPILTDDEFNLLADNGLAIENFRIKTNHVQPMGSLRKIKTREAFESWAKAYRIKSITPKLDGNSIEVVFNSGNLMQGITRGDGIVGNDITDKLKHVKITNFSNALKDGSHKAEAIMPKSKKDSYKKNIRNVTAGFLNKKTIDKAALEDIHILFFDNLTNYAGTVKTYDDLENLFNTLKTDYTYEIDGLVIELHNSPYEETDELLPKNKIALKFNKGGEEGEIGGVEWFLGKHDRLTPVLVLKEAVEIDGTNVQRVSASNYGLLKATGLGIGALVKVIKSGDIIPFISEIVEPVQLDDRTQPICPVCKSIGIIDENGVHACCLNPECAGKSLIKLQHIFKIFDLEYISKSTIELLYNAGFNTLKSIFNIPKEVLVNIPGIGERKADHIINKLKSITISESQVIECAMVKGIASTQAEKLIKHFGSLERFLMEWWSSQYMRVESFGPKLAEAVFVNKQKFVDINIELRGLVKIIPNHIIESPIGKSVVLTGKCEHYTRKELEGILKQKGYAIQSNVSASTSLLLTDDPNSNSGKTKNAIKLEISIMSYDEFLK